MRLGFSSATGSKSGEIRVIPRSGINEAELLGMTYKTFFKVESVDRPKNNTDDQQLKAYVDKICLTYASDPKKPENRFWHTGLIQKVQKLSAESVSTLNFFRTKFYRLMRNFFNAGETFVPVKNIQTNWSDNVEFILASTLQNQLTANTFFSRKFPEVLKSEKSVPNAISRLANSVLITNESVQCPTGWIQKPMTNGLWEKSKPSIQNKRLFLGIVGGLTEKEEKETPGIMDDWRKQMQNISLTLQAYYGVNKSFILEKPSVSDVAMRIDELLSSQLGRTNPGDLMIYFMGHSEGGTVKFKPGITEQDYDAQGSEEGTLCLKNFPSDKVDKNYHLSGKEFKSLLTDTAAVFPKVRVGIILDTCNGGRFIR